MAIQDGSLVWLKSGGPAMTVKWEDENTGGWVCTWFVKNEIKEHSFSEHQLTETDPNPPLML
jgi:uncharacterized protein YodC (DUF2158 family)